LDGTAEQIPADDKTIDGNNCDMTIHHWTDIKQAFAELDRVLEDRGKNCNFYINTRTNERILAQPLFS
jgi:ubiquinone/menaquinone biosynthesis C-methylase UbiE